MIVRVHRVRERGCPIPRYQFAFKRPIAGELVILEVRDPVQNRHSRVARLLDPATGAALKEVPQLIDVQVIALTRDCLTLSGIERHEDVAISKIEDFAQSWLCLLDGDDAAPTAAGAEG